MKTLSIERITDPTPEFFESKYVNENRPVVICGEVQKWPAFQSWSVPHFREKCLDVEVVVEVYPDGKDNGQDGYRDEKMTLGTYLDRLQSEAYRRYYLADQSLDNVLPALSQDVLAPSVLSAPIERQVVFIGRDTYSPNHFHANCEYLTSNVIGTKRFQLFAPSQTKRMYPRAVRHLKWYTFSNVDPNRDDVGKDFPAYLDAECYDVLLQPGEMIYIPVHWWHNVWGHDLGVSVVQTWPARKRNWTFPEPGLRVAAQRVLYRSLMGGKRVATAVGQQRRYARWATQKGFIDDPAGLGDLEG